MASSREYVQFVLEQLPEDVKVRPMMGEYLLYYRDRLFGGIYDDRLLVKVLPASESMLPDARREAPYAGGKEMLLVDRMEDKAFLQALLEAMYETLPAPKKRKSDRKEAACGRL